LPEGKSKYNYIFDPGNPALGLPEDVQFRRPLPQDNKTLPKYPENALAAHDGPHREVVRFVIDTEGSVDRIADSPMEASDGGPSPPTIVVPSKKRSGPGAMNRASFSTSSPAKTKTAMGSPTTRS
jgi:hypothetical protein